MTDIGSGITEAIRNALIAYTRPPGIKSPLDLVRTSHQQQANAVAGLAEAVGAAGVHVRVTAENGQGEEEFSLSEVAPQTKTLYRAAMPRAMKSHSWAGSLELASQFGLFMHAPDASLRAGRFFDGTMLHHSMIFIYELTLTSAQMKKAGLIAWMTIGAHLEDEADAEEFVFQHPELLPDPTAIGHIDRYGMYAAGGDGR